MIHRETLVLQKNRAGVRLSSSPSPSRLTGCFIFLLFVMCADNDEISRLYGSVPPLPRPLPLSWSSSLAPSISTVVVPPLDVLFKGLICEVTLACFPHQYHQGMGCGSAPDSIAGKVELDGWCRHSLFGSAMEHVPRHPVMPFPIPSHAGHSISQKCPMQDATHAH